MQRLSVLIGLASGLLVSAPAFGLTLTLTGAGPTGIVAMNAKPIAPSIVSPLGAYNGDSFYAGVLDWTTGGSTPKPYYTYCVDIASVIFVNNSYTFNSVPFSAVAPTQSLASSSLPAFTAPVIAGIENLWDQNINGFDDTLHATSNDSEALNTNPEAAALQIALWDIIYNGATGTLLDGSKSTSPLYFSNDNQSNLTSALGLAAAAYGKSAPADGGQGLTGLLATDGSQNQIYIGPPPIVGQGPTAPLPSMAAACSTLLGMVAAFGVFSKKFRSAQPA